MKQFSSFELYGYLEAIYFGLFSTPAMEIKAEAIN